MSDGLDATMTLLMIGLGVLPLWLYQFVGLPFEFATLTALGIIAAYIQIAADRVVDSR